MLPLLKPTLYADSGAGPVLLGGRCECGYVFFPMQSFGCERCGKNGAALRSQVLRGRGKLLTAAIVHMHADARRSAPFAIGTIALDEGPVIRLLLSDIAMTQDSVNKTVIAALAPVTVADGTQALDLRFNREAKDTALSGER